MDNHISFIESVYEKLRTPLCFIKENIEKTKHWEHWFWVNDEMFIPNDVKQYLIDINVTLVSVDTLQTFGDISHNNDLLLAAKLFARLEEFGMATDLAKYLVTS